MDIHNIKGSLIRLHSLSTTLYTLMLVPSHPDVEIPLLSPLKLLICCIFKQRLPINSCHLRIHPMANVTNTLLVPKLSVNPHCSDQQPGPVPHQASQLFPLTGSHH